jgi:uncharacterized surface protein with fasciclin (FAS1) repeats
MSPMTAFAQDEAATEEAPAEEMMAEDLVATLQAQGDFATLVGLIERAGLTEALQGDTYYTVFAPTDAAFAAAGADLDALSEDEIAEILRNHLIADTVDLAKAAEMGSVMSVQGSDLAVTKTDSGAMIGGANILQSDIMASNGVIHVIDAVLMPKESLGE